MDSIEVLYTWRSSKEKHIKDRDFIMDCDERSGLKVMLLNYMLWTIVQATPTLHKYKVHFFYSNSLSLWF